MKKLFCHFLKKLTFLGKVLPSWWVEYNAQDQDGQDQ